MAAVRSDVGGRVVYRHLSGIIIGANIEHPISVALRRHKPSFHWRQDTHQNPKRPFVFDHCANGERG